MTVELLLLRHGKSDWETQCDDFDRPLKDRGKRAAQRIGVWLAQHELEPDYIISSPAERALVSAQKCCKAMGQGAQGIHPESRVYAADIDMLLTVLADCPEQAKRVMLVGHNPALEDLLSWLSDEALQLPEDGKLLPTATLARLKLNENWKNIKQGCATVESIIRPRELPEKFPFPSPHGNERRDRPAYYYAQSSVIPWRVNNAELEILVILSSKNKHWVVPKGIWEPGLTARESAAREALEEAGVEGLVAETAIGTYAYPKWGASCTVEVYPMEVSRVLPEEEWQEVHRGREWVTLKQAAEKLKQDELKPMLWQLAAMLKNK
jgi:phosphohistidine phosphatase